MQTTASTRTCALIQGFFSLLVLWFAGHANAEDAQESAAGIQFFESKIRPLLIERCFECHSTNSGERQGGLLLDSRGAILQGGDNGAAVDLQQPEGSLLLHAIQYVDADISMPPDGKLTDQEIKLLEQWVQGGIPFPDGAEQPNAVEAKSIDIESAKQHWAFRDFQAVELPALTNSDWTINRIDTFVAAKHQELGLEPTATASKRELLRRAKIGLLGLAPSMEEITAFEADNSADAYERRIMQYLQSPFYGERWGRRWLELVRYCDIAEAWAESQGNAYLYRDWVIQAFNDDLPYDRFCRLQLAADQMEDAAPHDRAALGMLGLSPTYWKELQLPVEIIKTIVSDEYEERIHTWSSTFLGVNIACARCHDHKTEPFTVEDYYALAGVFANTRLADRALRDGVDGLAVYKAHKRVGELNPAIAKLKEEINQLKPQAEQSEATDEQKQMLAAKQAELEKLESEHQALISLPGYNEPLAPGVIDAVLSVQPADGTHGSKVVYLEEPVDVAIEIRGNPNRLGNVVPRRYASVLSKSEPPIFDSGSGRLDLAESMFAHSSAQIARVIVNRIWQVHFGKGLVDTPSDIGISGEVPSHPELLEDLAQRLVQHEWSLKWLHREIMLSATYQQGSLAKSEVDPENKWLAFAPIRRLDVETWRDNLLLASGNLDLRIGGPPRELAEVGNNRRTIYGIVRRRELTDILRLYDYPDPVTHSPKRIPTSTPLQQLFVLNSPFMSAQAKSLADRVQHAAPGQTSVQITHLYQWLYGRVPSEKEIRIGLDFIGDGGIEVWQLYAQALLGSNEFMYVD